MKRSFKDISGAPNWIENQIQADPNYQPLADFKQKRSPMHKWSPEEVKYLQEIFPTYGKNYSAIANAMINHFGTDTFPKARALQVVTSKMSVPPLKNWIEEVGMSPNLVLFILIFMF